MKPDFEVFAIQEPKKEGEKPFFMKIGALWRTKNGNGFMGNLVAVPVSGKVALFPPKEYTTGNSGQPRSRADDSPPVGDDEIPF